MKVFDVLSSAFNNRELAIGLWLVPLLAILMCKYKTRNPVLRAIQLFFQIKVFGIFFLMAVYVCGIILLLNLATFWEQTLLKTAIMWFVFSGIALAIKTFTCDKRYSPIKDIVIDNLKLWIVIEFIASAYTFSLIGELFFIPTVVFIALMSAVASTNSDYAIIQKIFLWIQGIVGLCVLFLGLLDIVNNVSEYGRWITLKEYITPPILSIASIPFFYISLLVMQYETMFLRLRYSEAERKGFIREAKLETIKHVNISYKRIRAIDGVQMGKLLRSSSISEFRRNLKHSMRDDE